MTLFEAKDAARKESRTQKGKLFYVTVEGPGPNEGECDLTANPKNKMVLHCYKNGSEIAVDPKLNQADPQTINTMATAKKSAKKEKAKKEPKEKKPRKWNPEPQFGFSAEAWKKLVAIGQKENLSFVQLMRKTVAEKYKTGE